MDDRTGKPSVKGLKTVIRRTTANIHVGRVEKLLLLLVSSFFFLPPKNEEN
jgi:hypothetical protein